jgi:hypothetical protein
MISQLASDSVFKLDRDKQRVCPELTTVRLRQSAGSSHPSAIWMAYRSIVVFGAFALAGLATSRPTLAATHAEGSIAVSINQQSQPPLQTYSTPILGVQAGDGVNYDRFGPGIPSEHAQANSEADGFGVHAHAFADYIVVGPSFSPFNFYGIGATSQAWVTFVDVVVTGPAGGIVSTVLNLNLDGGQLGGAAADPGGSAFASSSVNVAVGINGASVGHGHREVNFGSNTNTVTTIGLDMLANGVGHIVTPAFNVTVGVPFEVYLELDTQASITANLPSVFGMTAEANTDFSDTLSFALTGPVFNLPAGYTANSAAAGIVNNSFVVPEPSSLLLAFFGLAAVVLVRRRHRQSQ